MTKTKLAFLLACVLFMLAIVLVLYMVSHNKHYFSKNGFTRVFSSKTPVEFKSINLKYPDYYIAGYTDSHIYLGNYQTPLHILQVNYDLTDTTYLKQRSRDTTKFRWKSAMLQIDSPYVYLNEGGTPVLFYSRLDSLTLLRHMENSYTFLTSVSISSSSVILKTIQARENILIKQTKYPPYIKKGDGILEKQIDGIFCTDGMLNYDRITSKLVYIYFYRNKFICMDTSLNVLYTSNTIDTTTIAKIDVAHIESEQQTTLASPPHFVNRKSRVFNNRLFIQSSLMADNESKREIGQRTVIDTYSLINGKYLFSFFIPHHDNQKVRDFQATSNSIVALYDRHLYVYELDLDSLTDIYL